MSAGALTVGEVERRCNELWRELRAPGGKDPIAEAYQRVYFRQYRSGRYSASCAGTTGDGSTPSAALADLARRAEVDAVRQLLVMRESAATQRESAAAELKRAAELEARAERLAALLTRPGAVTAPDPKRVTEVL